MDGFISVGDVISTDKYDDVTITMIQLHKKGGKGDDTGSIEVERAPLGIVNEYIDVILDNGHWAHGYQIKDPKMEANIKDKIKRLVEASKSDKEIIRIMSADSNFVSVYFVTRQYGGPEEGGWWYNWYELEKSVSVNSEEEADKVKIELEKEYFYERDGLYSVNGQGTYEVLKEEVEGESESTETPHYE